MTGSTNKIDFYGKIAKLPKNSKASKAYSYLENIKISKKKLWYFIIEKDNTFKSDGTIDNQLQLIKYNNTHGFDCNKFLLELKKYYSKNENINKYIESLVIEGNDKYSIIRNIQNVDINGKKLIQILTEDLIKILK